MILTASGSAGQPGAAAAHADPLSLDVGRRMMAFNWLPGAYAHADWLGPWAEVLGPRENVSTRVIQRISVLLLDRYDLRVRFLRDAGSQGWLLQSHAVVWRLATRLGTAMLGGWVRGRLERREVALQQALLGAEGRQQALRYAHELKALPFPPSGADWAPEMGEPIASDTVARLGVSCMAALLTDVHDGARERFTLRFALGAVSPLALSAAQRSEAQALIDTADEAPGAPA